MPDEIEVPTLPALKIIQDGKPVDTSAIDNYDSFMNFLMLASVAANTAKIKKYHEDRKSKGKTLNYDLTVTEVIQEVRCAYPCQTLYLENTGLNDVHVALNSLGTGATPVAPNRSAYYEFETHVIEQFYVWTDPGVTSTAIALLKY